jgi:hypothetical protein
VALQLRGGSSVSAALAIIAVPLIASRMTPRAEIFTIVLFAAVFRCCGSSMKRAELDRSYCPF